MNQVLLKTTRTTQLSYVGHWAICLCSEQLCFAVAFVHAVYDVTRADTLQHLESKWLEDFKQYSSHEQAVKMVVGNKIDLVSWFEGAGKGGLRGGGQSGG